MIYEQFRAVPRLDTPVRHPRFARFPMISWIQKTFQQHFRIIFAIVLGGLIVSFIMGINPSGGFGRSDRGEVADQFFFGLNLSNGEDVARLRDDTAMSIQLETGRPPYNSDQLEQFAFQRQAALYLAKQLGIPASSGSEIKDHIQKLRFFAGETGQFDAKRYNDYCTNLRKNSPEAEGHILRIISENLRAKRVVDLIGGPGYVLPHNIKKYLETAETSWTLDVASIEYESFKPAITPSAADLAKFFEQHSDNYTIPPRVTLSYVSFPTADFLSATNVTEEEVRAYYDANPARFPKPADTKPATPGVAPTPADAAKDYAAVRIQVELALRMEKAMRLAAKAASDLSVALYNARLDSSSPGLAEFLSSRKLTINNAAPFTLDKVPEELGGSPQVAEEASRLDAKHSVSDPVVSTAGAYVLLWKNTEPPRAPALAEVTKKVSDDFIVEEKQRRFVELGRTVRGQIIARLKAGDAFAKAVETAAASANVKIDSKSHPAFTLRQPAQDLDSSLFSELQRSNLNQGDTSELIEGRDNKGLLVHVSAKKVPELNESNPQYVTARTQLAQFSTRISSSSLVNEYIATEQAKNKSVVAR